MTRVKICGLTRPADAAHAEAVGAAYLGVILAGGPRLLDVADAARVLGPRRAGVSRVAVFGSQTVEETLRIADTLDLDVLQLHGDPTPQVLSALRRATTRALWPVLRVEGGTLPSEASALVDVAGALVLDAKVIGQLGGTGIPLDWHALAGAVRALRERHPAMTLILAGGLRVLNVADALAVLDPDVVDVSSGVEISPGVKDPQAVQQFVSAVTTARRAGDDGRRSPDRHA